MLAIVIPYFKITFLEETLSSLDKQTDKNFNLYIGDDASNDDPTVVIKKYEKNLKVFYTRFERNVGKKSLVRQWERCIALKGDEEWIMVLGDDDLLHPKVVESFYKHHPVFQGKSNVIRFASRILFNEKNKLSNIFEHPVWEKAEDSFMRRFRGLSRSSLSEYIFSAKAYEKYGFHDYRLAWHSDDWGWLEFSENKPIYSINEAVVYFRHSEHNITGKVDNLQDKEIAAEQFYKYLAGSRFRFKKEEKLIFARIYERSLRKKGPLSYKDWLELVRIYLLNYEPEVFKKMLKRIVREKFLRKEVTV